MPKKVFEECEVLFEKTSSSVDNRGALLYRTKTVKAGKMLYVDCFPIWDTARQADAKTKARSPSLIEAQKRLNVKNAQTRFEQIINANFHEGDIMMTLTYSKDNQPADIARATRDMQNLVRRTKRQYEKVGLELRYAFVTETTYSAKNGLRFHHHMIVNAGISRETLESLWKNGNANTRRLKEDDYGLSGIAEYMVKQMPGKMKQAAESGKRTRMYKYSKNLKVPEPTRADHKISARKVERIAADVMAAGKAIFEKAYKGYKVLDDIKVKMSDYVPGAYISLRLRKTE